MRARGLTRIVNADLLFLSSIALLVFYLTVVPISVMFFGSFQRGLPGSVSPVTFENYVRAFSNTSIYSAILNSVTYSVGAGMISFILGTYLAWLTERTDVPFKGFIYSSVVTAMMIPGVLFTISWILLLTPKAGLINVAREAPRAKRSTFRSLRESRDYLCLRHLRFFQPVSLPCR